MGFQADGLLAEVFAVALVAEAGVPALRIMQCLVVPTVSAVLLASHMALDALACRADFVSHVILKPVPSNLCPDYDNLILRNPDRFATPWTKIHAQSDQLIEAKK